MFMFHLVSTRGVDLPDRAVKPEGNARAMLSVEETAFASGNAMSQARRDEAICIGGAKRPGPD
ncbi:MAG: hypothetical protein L6Q92_14165 [Phycisphaerae bacterium]|nr:hypothetical protein [Phycisphaerae bacterium]